MIAPSTCVVLIEDDQAMNYYHQRLFVKQDFADEVLSYHSAKEALNGIKSLQQVTLLYIFLDLNMPQMDGWHFIEELEKLKFDSNTQIKLFVLSSSVNPNDMMKAKQNSAVTDYLSKPLSIETITNIITTNS
ncbi:response regulator [Flavobacterium sp.]|jgi:CheY-like chemotaxis protein|uniref:response regulator n=1 Tax=Flavobacterium sp. TaxID=239 RepID=UPI0037BFC532